MNAILVALALASADAAAASSVKRNAVQADLGLAVIGLAYERLLTDRVALQVEAHIFGTWFMNPYAAGVGGQVRPTWFVLEDGARGLYVAPFFRFEKINRYNGVDANGTSWSAGAWAGWSWIFLDALNVRVGAGAQYFTVEVEGSPRFGTAMPAIDAVVGWMF